MFVYGEAGCVISGSFNDCVKTYSVGSDVSIWVHMDTYVL